MHATISRGAIAALMLTVGAAHAGETILAVTANQTLITYDSDAPGAVLSGLAISGLDANEQIRGIDLRPATGRLYALGSFGGLYTIDTSTGVATRVGAGGSGSSPLNGSSFGFDFNPTIDKIRVVSDADQNLVYDPDTGAATAVTSLFYAGGDPNQGVNPNVVASSYTNSFAGATTTQLYGVDTALDALVTQANSAGTLSTVGLLGADVNDTLSFDISGLTGIGYMTVQAADKTRSTFWTVDLTTGEAMMIGEIGGGALITSMTVVPAPGGAALAAISLAGLTRRRRR
ncbi:MAG: DUF4394 domain-containing protein [Phycisphaerales bacterium JB040]